ncbi:MAG: prolipoprotein diacylglyceryl transferase [Alphaproteobacteria bacterium 64-11]|nr:prolipoprotein diacylglyceryl transferase [Alphaproteobacteria bacterium]OJU14001.1 MAG: prolipoprotein diacylglyceryl transferase [Alphaproteobacteria bacterium 64-11]
MIQALLPYPHIDPVLVQLGPLAIRWYALSYIAGIVLAWWGIVRVLRLKALWAHPPFNGRPPAGEDDIGDLVVWATFGVIIGGRLGWVLIYGIILCSVTPDYGGFCTGLPMDFLYHPIRIIAAWEGGMSFHGGLLGVVIATWLFCRRRKLKMLPIADLVAAFAPIGLFFGRIANFINGELWGRPTDVPWAMIFPRGGNIPRHPSQLYEAALEGILLLVIMQVALRVFRANERPGLLSAIFFLGYGTFRFIVEWFREPDSQFIGPISMGMALSIPVWLGAGLLFWVAYRKPAAR